MARGDRKIADVIMAHIKTVQCMTRGRISCVMEYWDKAYEETRIDPDFYTLRERVLMRGIPLGFYRLRSYKNFLIREWKTAHEDKISPDYRQQCLGCGAKRRRGVFDLESAIKFEKDGSDAFLSDIWI